jgi:sugar phosphate isomerase/epimerase
MLDQSSREIPGDGIAPVDRVLQALAKVEYAGTLSVELFLPRFAQAEPFTMATEIKRKSEAVMKRAGVA